MSATAIGIGVVAVRAGDFHVPLAAMIAVGIVAFALQTDWGPALTYLASEPSQVSAASIRHHSAVPADGRVRGVPGFSSDL